MLLGILSFRRRGGEGHGGGSRPDQPGLAATQPHPQLQTTSATHENSFACRTYPACGGQPAGLAVSVHTISPTLVGVSFFGLQPGSEAQSSDSHLAPQSFLTWARKAAAALFSFGAHTRRVLEGSSSSLGSQAGGIGLASGPATAPVVTRTPAELPPPTTASRTSGAPHAATPPTMAPRLMS